MYLKSLPVSVLKIDGAFVRDAGTNQRTESMVRAIAQLARTMGMETVAEYVETDDLRTRMAALGVDYGQGFAIGRPVPIDQVLADLALYQAMAQQVMKLRDPKAIFVALSGNVHSRRTKGTQWDPDLVPTVAHLVAAKLPVVTFNVSPHGGKMWACMSTPDHEPVCGEHDMHDGGPGEPWTLGPARDNSHYGVYYVGPTTASYPAKQPR